MQKEAIETSICALKKQERLTGHARGRIILPCGAGKTRIALQIVEQLTPKGQVSVVLCPSIALVAQLRREFLFHTKQAIAALAVCSDETAAHSREESKHDDPTADRGFVKANQIKGQVTTNPEKIANWIDRVEEDSAKFGVIFGTYQSAYKIAEALTGTPGSDGGVRHIGGKQRKIMCLIADEAHRTSGIRKIAKKQEAIRNFTICHNNETFPAKFRIYQTATPKLFNIKTKTGSGVDESKMIVRSMDDETIFGPELYRRSYKDAVKNGWLSDYRIIALGVNDQEAYQLANNIADEQIGSKLTTASILKGLPLALVMVGATSESTGPIRSSISFLNTIEKSMRMTDALNSQKVQDWVHKWMDKRKIKSSAIYKLQHLDATSRVTQREKAKADLAQATENAPFGICNVGIFGEGTDAPSLSAVAFLEPRKSPVDVVQAVGRVMRRSEGKTMGYVICPVLIPRNQDAETWLRTSGPQDGWRELGQILQALRAHDSRIEENLADLMTFYLPSTSDEEDDTENEDDRTPGTHPQEDAVTFVTIGGKNGKLRHYRHVGKRGTVMEAAKRVALGEVKPGDVGFDSAGNFSPSVSKEEIKREALPNREPERLVSVRVNSDHSIEMREDGIVRDKGKTEETPGPINLDRTRKRGRDMVNRKAGRTVSKRKTKDQIVEQQMEMLFGEAHIDKIGVTVNLLERSGLMGNRADRDLNLLQESVAEACRSLRGDELDTVLNQHFGLDKQKTSKDTADGCNIAALLLMNAAMLHQRIAVGEWIDGISELDEIKSATDANQLFYRQWNNIARWDFLPVLEPAIRIIETIQECGRTSGLNMALRHIAKEAAAIAENYADLGADHAGPLFNKVMGNQSSDGAYFTRPPAGSLLARLALDAAGQSDWSHETTWRDHRSVDLACGSGTLLAALLTDMLRRAKDDGASDTQLDRFRKLAVEEMIGGFDMNAVSLQLAATQLISGNRDIRYEKINLHRMPYGPLKSGQTAVGTLELLLDAALVPVPDLGFDYADPASEQLDLLGKTPPRSAPVPKGSGNAAKNVRIVIMNPPFTNRAKMAQKFDDAIRASMRRRVDDLQDHLLTADPGLDGFVSKNSIGPLFEALAEKCLDPDNGVLAMILPTIALSGPDKVDKRKIFSKQFHLHTVLTCHQPGQLNLSQNTGINESMIIATRLTGRRPPTRIISLDRFPLKESEVSDLHKSLRTCCSGLIPNGWGEVSDWPAERVINGDWTGAIWRSPELAAAAADMTWGGGEPLSIRARRVDSLGGSAGRSANGEL